jgi:hypothetical protein
MIAPTRHTRRHTAGPDLKEVFVCFFEKALLVSLI